MELLPWVLAGSSLVLVMALLFTKPQNTLEDRLDDLGEDALHHKTQPAQRRGPHVVLPSVREGGDQLRPLRNNDAGSKPTLQERLLQAGIYRALGKHTFLLLRVAGFLAPIGIGIAAARLELAPAMHAIGLGVVFSLIGTITPSLLLDYLKTQRQMKLRRALPDALDTIVVCLEGGLGLAASLARVSAELANVHPLLALEMKIVDREIQMGRPTGEAMRNFAKRFDLEELRSMAMVITQAERFGSSVSTALSVYADSIRLKRAQQTEERAHKAVVKMIFPTLLCIFPAIFVVVLGPAAIQIARTLLPTLQSIIQ
jgi:tight adherence protein C